MDTTGTFSFPPCRLEKIALPLNETDLNAAAGAAQADALSRFERDKFGTGVESLRQALSAALEKELA